jgi:nicotinamidase-related amidase
MNDQRTVNNPPETTRESDPESRERAFLRRIVDPSSTAVITMELQNGIVGRDAMLPDLVEEVERVGLLDVVRRLCDAARSAGIRVVHCTHATRPDNAGATVNCRIFAMSERMRRETGHSATEIGRPGVELVEGLEDPRDIVVQRLTGMTPFTSTSLDQMLRNLGVKTVIATGVSVNLGIFGMALTALDLGYQVVVVRDAVAGVPAEFAQAVLDQSLSLISTVVTSEDLLAVLRQD